MARTTLCFVLKIVGKTAVDLLLYLYYTHLATWITLAREAISSSCFKFVSFSVNVIICTRPGRPTRSTVQTVPLLEMTKYQKKFQLLIDSLHLPASIPDIAKQNTIAKVSQNTNTHRWSFYLLRQHLLQSFSLAWKSLAILAKLKPQQ